jgi:D-alanyl-D-alanine endopeptidase (penicillin-binding protein 7)
MKQVFKLAVLVGALLGLGLGGQANAATDTKKTQSAARKTESKASAGATKAAKTAAAPAGKPVATNAPKKSASVAAQKSVARQAGNGQAGAKNKSASVAPQKTVARQASNGQAGGKKSLRKVSMADVDPSHLALYSASALVIDQETGQTIIEKQSGAVVPIASISKLMTAMVVLDAKLDMNEVITIGDDDVDGLKGTRSRIPVGTAMTRETAMLLALMSSENRAANSLGRHYPGGMPAFVRAMNRKAQALGMLNSRFEEPTGLSSNNVSTAHDLARMVAAAARYPEIRSFSTTGEARIDLNGHIREFHNTNALVRSDSWEIGVSKTGYISEAGRCLVMQARVADKPVVIVLLDSAGKMTRVGDANRIKRWMESASLTPERRPV